MTSRKRYSLNLSNPGSPSIPGSSTFSTATASPTLKAYPSTIETAEPDSSIKLLLIGEAGVGKTALILNYCEPPADDDGHILPEIELKSTIGVDLKINMVNVDNKLFKVILWDTAGQERYRNAMIPSLYKGTNAVVFVYDISDLSTLHALKEHWVAESAQLCSPETRFYLLGNKIDKFQDRQVGHDDVLEFLDVCEVKIAQRFEASSRYTRIVEGTFNMIIKDLVEHGSYQGERGVQLDRSEKKCC